MIIILGGIGNGTYDFNVYNGVVQFALKPFINMVYYSDGTFTLNSGATGYTINTLNNHGGVGPISLGADLSQNYIFANCTVTCNDAYYGNHIYNINENLSSEFTIPSLTVIDNPNSDIVLSYNYDEYHTTCHIDATIRNGAFSDKLFYSYQMPSISGQGLTLGKTQFPSRWFRYN